tara:strand:- start:2460 stop:3104 length:645 start_codon:yes stop_codon:yes gene_type:complete
MYKEFIFFIFIFCIIYFFFFYDNRIDWKADNGQTYKIMDSKDPNLNKKKANMLSEINDKAQKVVELMYNQKVPTEKIATKTRQRFNKNFKIKETPMGEKSGAAYTINKGGLNGEMSVCLVTKGKLNNLNDTFFVILHELAHVMSDSYGHGDEFKQNFNFIIAFAVKHDLWTDPKYENRNVDYCGVTVTSSPCSGNQCEENTLNNFYKESLLDYK